MEMVTRSKTLLLWSAFLECTFPVHPRGRCGTQRERNAATIKCTCPPTRRRNASPLPPRNRRDESRDWHPNPDAKHFHSGTDSCNYEAALGESFSTTGGRFYFFHVQFPTFRAIKTPGRDGIAITRTMRKRLSTSSAIRNTLLPRRIDRPSPPAGISTSTLGATRKVGVS